MHRWDKTMKEDRYKHDGKSPSFSSTLLDEIYRSICEGDTKHEDLKFYSETVPKKQTKCGANALKNSRAIQVREDDEKSALRRACLIDKWMETEKISQITQYKREFDRKAQHQDHDLEHDSLYFSSTSISSDSSFGGFSSSDTESIYGARSRASSLPLPRPKPVWASLSSRPEKTQRTGRSSTMFYEQRELHMFGDYHYNYAIEPTTPKFGEESMTKTKSRALKIYNNLKKVKQPISPGGKLANFINSLFTNGNTKKSKNSSSTSFYNCDEERKLKSGQASSTCSSASSFSRSCLSKNSPATREKLRNGVKRTVRFYPVSVIVDEDSRPCGHKCLYQEQEAEESSLMSVSLPTAWKIGKSPSRNMDELKYQVMEKTRRVEEVAREFLKDYHHQNQNKNNNDDLFMRDIHCNFNDYDDEKDDDDDDDAASYSSSDLFELDNLSVIGRDRYCQELPVYETTHVDTNRAIANGLIM